jgi:hypothetical protein
MSTNTTPLINNATSVYPGVSSSDAKILSSFFVSCALFGLLMAFFLFFKKKVPQVFESRCVQDKDVASPRGGLFGFVISAFEPDMTWILKHRGLDVVVYLLMLQYMIFAISPCTLVAVAVLMPVYRSVCSRGDVVCR